MKKNKGSAQVTINEKLVLRLYVSGMSPKSMEAIENIRTLFKNYPEEKYSLEIVDIYQHPEKASQDHIIFSPSLIKVSPLPKKVLIGTTYNTERVKSILGLPLDLQ
jgi:circadian clock protein KaiB